MKRAIAVAVLAVAAIGATTGTAGAEAPTPNGYIGACNMMQAPAMMSTTMSAISPQGMDGDDGGPPRF